MKMSGIQAQVELLTAANSKLQLQVLKNATVKSSTQSSFELVPFLQSDAGMFYVKVALGLVAVFCITGGIYTAYTGFANSSAVKAVVGVGSTISNFIASTTSSKTGEIKIVLLKDTNPEVCCKIITISDSVDLRFSSDSGPFLDFSIFIDTYVQKWIEMNSSGVLVSSSSEFVPKFNNFESLLAKYSSAGGGTGLDALPIIEVTSFFC